MRKFFLHSTLAISLCGMPMMLSAQSSALVREAQQALKDKGFYQGEVDGLRGPQTTAAVRSYQQKSFLTVDGRLGPQTLDSLGIRHTDAGANFKTAGSNLKNSYSTGGKDMAEGGKALGSEVKHGEVVDGAKTFGKEVGQGAAKIGVGTGHAAKNAAKGVKNAVTGNR